VVHTAPWPHYPNKNVFSDCWNGLYDKSASLRCDRKLFQSLGPAVAKVLVSKATVGVCNDTCLVFRGV